MLVTTLVKLLTSSSSSFYDNTTVPVETCRNVFEIEYHVLWLSSSSLPFSYRRQGVPTVSFEARLHVGSSLRRWSDSSLSGSGSIQISERCALELKREAGHSQDFLQMSQNGRRSPWNSSDSQTAPSLYQPPIAHALLSTTEILPSSTRLKASSAASPTSRLPLILALSWPV